MATWPPTLPQIPLAEAYREASVARAIRTQMEIGPAKQRLRFTGSLKLVQCSFDLTAAQKATFEAFWGTTLGAGAEQFDWADPITGAIVYARFVADQPPAVVAKEGDLYFVECQLEVSPTVL